MNGVIVGDRNNGDRNSGDRNNGDRNNVWFVTLVSVAVFSAAGCGSKPASTGANTVGGTPDAGSTPTSTVGVVGMGANGSPVCFPLCKDASTDPDINGVTDGFGYENQMSCVVPGSLEARSRVTCTVGAPVPTTVGPPAGSAGVAGLSATGMSVCFPLCSVVTVAVNGDFGFEFGAPCVLPGTPMASVSLPCKTGASVPVRDLTGLPGRLLNEVCTPYCTTAAADPGGAGFGFEFGAGCIVKGSTPATTMGIDCTIGDDVLKPTVVVNPNPPPGAVAKPPTVASKGFFVANGKLYDKFGNAFIIRGINNADIYYDSGNRYFAYQALDRIAKLGTNTVRIVWNTTGGASILARLIRRVVELRMIPMVELDDKTGDMTNEGLLQMVAFYTKDDVKQVLLAYENFLLVNIANEWSGTDFRNAYTMAISQMRAAGINHTLVIDSNGFGQNATTIVTDGAALLAADPQHNLMFSLHMYETYPATTAGRALITSALGQPTSMGLPLMVGEFGWQHLGVAVDIQFIMSECGRLGLGYLPWSWKGNSLELAYLDMAVDWQGQTLTMWGMDVIQGPNGITATAHPASIFTP